jgi:serine/threonine-protein kinase
LRFEPGEVIEGRYKILRPIADGGMGTVFLAEHWLIKRKVAIKILHSELATDATMIRRFMNEATAAGTLGHPNIVESTDMGFARSDTPYIVFEYLEGRVLSDEIARRGPLPVPRALRVAHQIASALEAAHTAGIIHRDLKSDNIFLTELQGIADHVKVLDFGISRFTMAPDRTGRGSGTLLGTPEFMAPEQVLAPDAIDHRVDIYALGVVLYEMLAGQVPFRLHDRPETLPKHLELEATHALLDRIVKEPPPALAVSEPVGLSEMIHERLLAKHPDKRFQSMKDVQAAVEAFATVLPEGPIAMRPKRAASPAIDRLSDWTVSRSRLDPVELAREVRALGKRWSLSGEDLVLDLYHHTMTKLSAVVAQAAAIADEMDHQPSISIALPHLRVTIAKANTVIDLVFAARLEQWLRDNW